MTSKNNPQTFNISGINMQEQLGKNISNTEKGIKMEKTCQSSKICKLEKSEKIVALKKPRRITKNKDVRNREYLTEDEVEKIKKAIRKHSRNATRDETLLLMMYKHGLRVSEAVSLKWSQIDLNNATLHVSRTKGSKDSVHPIAGEELRLLRKLQRQENNQRYLFLSERKSPIDSTTVYRMVSGMGKKAGLSFPIHPHMLRHGCGYYLANKGTDTRTIQMYLGHANISNTVIYTELNAERFDGLWK